jgi:diketogulonate reductase-like aldo/keto reductase
MKHTVILRNGDQVPALGLGTWYLGEDRRRRKQELESIKEGVHAGMTLIDTAEMYGSGKAELLVKEAMIDILQDMKREELYLVSKVLPNHAGKGKLETALDNTLMRMGVEQLDLYLYHWRGSYLLEETVAELERVKKAGKIREWGVSNFDIDDMEELWEIPGGQNCLVNQVLYHTGSRGIEYSLLPWMREHEVALMSYCPLA